MDTRADRPYDIVLFGATGFTGRLVARHLADEPGLAWALAGRNRDKLEALRTELARERPALKDLPILVADTQRPEEIAAVVQTTRVVCTTVGPYDLLGEPVVAACAEHGTHYCDLTGEVPFIRRMIERYHDLAMARGARIVHCCGFDSIPSDLGTFALQREVVARYGAPATRVRFTMKKARGGFSGGTVASLVNVVERMKDPALRKVVGHPYALNPEGERTGSDRGDGMKPERDPATGRWLGPFLMGPVNTRVVRRSHALAGFPWGRGFRYDEVMDFGPGLSGLAKATGVGVGLVAFLMAMGVPPLKRLLEAKVLPAPGDGPSEDLIKNGFFVAELTGEVDGRVVKMQVRGEGDPGYGATSKMLAQSALCLAQDPPAGTLPAGVLTPSIAMGEALIKRLATVGITFTPV